MSLIPAEYSYKAFVSERSLGSENDDQRNVAVFLLTPVGASAPFYNHLSVWSQFTNSMASADENTLSRESLMLGLYHMICRFNSDLLKSLSSTEAKDRSLAKAAFQPGSDKGGKPEWHHCLMQMLLLDKLFWASSEQAGADTRPLQSPHLKQISLPKQTEKAYSLYTHWEETTSKFVGNWVLASSADGRNSGPSTSEMLPLCSTFAQRANTIITSLYRGAEDSYAGMQVSKVENNFCCAALALLSLFLVNTTFLSVISNL